MSANKLYVAGVSWNTSDEAFSAFFSAFGAVQEALVMREQNGRSRGFGFVTYEDSASVEKVLNQTLQLDGRKLDIKLAVSKDEMAINQQNNPKSTKKMYVAGLDYSTDDDAFFTYFTRFGEVAKAEVVRDKHSGKSRGFGFITFTNESSVEEALAEQAQTPLQLGSRPLEIKAAVPRGSSALIKGRDERGGPDIRSKKIYVAGLLATTTEDTLREHFNGFGKVSDCYIQRNRATGESRMFAFVQYNSEEEVREVLKHEHTVDGNKLDCKVAIPRPERGGHGGQMQMQMQGGYMDYGMMQGYGMMGQGPMYGGGYGGRGNGGGGQRGAMGRQHMPQNNGGVAAGGQGGAQGMPMTQMAGQQMGMPHALAAGQQMAMGNATPAMVNAAQYGTSPQSTANFAANERYGQQPYHQANVYAQGQQGGFEGQEEGGFAAGNPYGAGNGYGAYGGRAQSGRPGRNGGGSNFHPYSR